MNFPKNLHIKFYYHFWNKVLPKRKIFIQGQNETKQNLFIYFDYEREFGGHSTKINNQDVSYLLNLLEKNAFKTTWFAVGKIFEKYPESVQMILDKGHEIGSHTFNHISPYGTNKKNLNDDFSVFYNTKPSELKISGFHSPNGQWSCKMFKLLEKYGFSYDLVSCKKNQLCYPHELIYSLNKKRVRFVTKGDDWPVFNKGFTPEQVYDYFLSVIEKTQAGNITGIGFHPWVLFSDPRILKGFELFLEYLANSEHIHVDSIEIYFKQLNKHD